MFAAVVTWRRSPGSDEVLVHVFGLLYELSRSGGTIEQV